jgi:hypothetical protein
MSSNSETILSQQTHIGDSSVQSVTGSAYKGDGYYGRSDGFHTVQIDLNGFLGKIEIQGTLSIDPADEDWFAVELGTGTMSVDTTGALTEQNITYIEYTETTTNTKSYNFVGNYVWVRAKISNWTDGTVNSVQLNH